MHFVRCYRNYYKKISTKKIYKQGTDCTIARPIPKGLQILGGLREFIIKFMSVRAISSLPQRNKGSYLDHCQKVTVLSNLFKVDFKETAKVYIYAIKTTPEMPRENGSKFRQLLASSRSAIQRHVGSYIISGRTIFATKLLASGKEDFSQKVSFDSTSYQISLKMVKEINFSEILAPEKEKSAIVFSFLNNMMRNFFHKMKYTQIGRSRKFFDPMSKKSLNGANVTVYKGFSTNFALLQSGLYLKVDPIMKIIRSESVLEVINNLYKVNGNATKTQKRLIVEEELIGKMVMANYGKNNCYVIDSIVFDISLDSCQFNHDNKCVNILQYYSHTYDITIQSKRQPLLKAKSSRKIKNGQEKDVLLIPQLCLMSGLPDNFDERKRREISESTITNPGAKLDDIESMFQGLGAIDNEYNPKDIGEKLGIKLSSSPMPVNAKQLKFPQLMLGSRQKIDDNKAANFMLFNKLLFNRDINLKICVFLPANFDFSPIKKLLQSTSSNIGLQCKLTMNPINYSEYKVALRNIENVVISESQNKSANIFWFIIPANFKTHYKTIKRMTLKTGIEINSQVTVSNNLEKKGFQSIFTKILLQMATKVGNKLWVPKVSSKVQNSGVMLIGIESTKDSQIRDKNIISYCANSTKDFSSFYSNFIYEGKDELKTNMKEIISNTITEYINKNSAPPSEVFILKNGTTKLDTNCYIQAEVAEVKEWLKAASKNDPIKLTYIILDKNASQKFFIEKGRDVANPCSGTLVNSQAVGKNFEFYLIAQQCNRGTVKPTYYKVAYTDSSLEEGVIEELIYSQCFNYMNWTGSIKVPSILQYAKKLGAFIGQYVNKENKFENLSKNLYFI